MKANKKLKAIDQVLKEEVSREGNDLSNAHSILTPERMAEVMRRINENFYDREEVLQVVATRILKSPKLQAILKQGRIKS